MDNFTDKAVIWLLDSGIKIFLIFFAAYILNRIFKIAIKRFQTNLEKNDPTGEAGKRANTLGTLLRTIAIVAILLVAIMMVLSLHSVSEVWLSVSVPKTLCVMSSVDFLLLSKIKSGSAMW
jgi:magnesium-transporting ATPase (P-type)